MQLFSGRVFCCCKNSTWCVRVVLFVSSPRENRGVRSLSVSWIVLRCLLVLVPSFAVSAKLLVCSCLPL